MIVGFKDNAHEDVPVCIFSTEKYLLHFIAVITELDLNPVCNPNNFLSLHLKSCRVEVQLNLL